MFIDAAALVAILSIEVEAERCLKIIGSEGDRFTSPIAIWEAAVALARPDKLDLATDVSERLVLRLLEEQGIATRDLPPWEIVVPLSLEAAQRFGSGRRRLNLADCFHYACARHHGAPILSTANEFRLTDLEVAP